MVTKDQIKPGAIIENPKAYAIGHRKSIKLSVEVFLDGVPGAMHQVEDHIDWIFQLPYVRLIELPKEL